MFHVFGTLIGVRCKYAQLVCVYVFMSVWGGGESRSLLIRFRVVFTKFLPLHSFTSESMYLF